MLGNLVVTCRLPRGSDLSAKNVESALIVVRVTVIALRDIWRSKLVQYVSQGLQLLMIGTYVIAGGNCRELQGCPNIGRVCRLMIM